MLITNEILSSFVNCQYKAYLKVTGHKEDSSDFQKHYTRLKQLQIKLLRDKLKKSDELILGNYFPQKVFSKEGTSLTINFTNSRIHLVLDGIEHGKKNTIIPIFVSPFEKVTRTDKLYLALQATIIQENFNLPYQYCKVIFGQHLKEMKFSLSSFSKISRRLITDLNKVISTSNAPIFYKNAHCQSCEFQFNCLNKLKERDDLSLLAGLKPKEILQKNSRGIFSVKQLSYFFRPKKAYSRRVFQPELKALAIREKKSFIQDIPIFRDNELEIYIDFEGILDRGTIYLIGIIVKSKNLEKEYSFWANDRDEQVKVLIQFLDLIKGFEHFIIYHYGSYEIKILRSMSKLLTLEYQELLNKVVNNSYDILAVFTHNVYPPTYSNNLKDIAQFLGFTWTDRQSSGFQSTLWRYSWEINHDNQYKDKLVKYNIEDCRALMIVKEWLDNLGKKDANMEFVKNIKSENIYKWGITNYIIKDFAEINSKAYFDYQREHIYLRSDKKNYRTRIKPKSKNGIYNKVDKKISLFPVKCPFCKSKNLTILHVCEKLQIDISFMRSGIKKKAILYSGGPSLCNKCKKKILTTNMKRLPMYGYNLMMWAVNQKIQYKQSSEHIINFLKDSLKIEVSATRMTTFKSIIAQKYLITYNQIISEMAKSELIHIDETIARIKNIDGYVWVFANHDSVYYKFKETREPEFLKELLKHFKGTLVTDFYTGYDSLECMQQKCLIHLIRDLNGDFLKHQLDLELKKIVTEFGSLLRSIITTIDKYGLKRIHLIKHKRNVNKFYSNVVSRTFESEYALAYQKRLLKYREKLFHFLNFDNIPWNNNNAEHSIKPFAKWRRKISKSLTKKNIEDHLILLSILQTCRYRGINFFEFLKSGEVRLKT